VTVVIIERQFWALREREDVACMWFSGSSMHLGSNTEFKSYGLDVLLPTQALAHLKLCSLTKNKKHWQFI
jgi:hypothetical protein